jgi:hypothetical protein
MENDADQKQYRGVSEQKEKYAHDCRSPMEIVGVTIFGGEALKIKSFAVNTILPSKPFMNLSAH